MLEGIRFAEQRTGWTAYDEIRTQETDHLRNARRNRAKAYAAVRAALPPQIEPVLDELLEVERYLATAAASRARFLDRPPRERGRPAAHSLELAFAFWVHRQQGVNPQEAYTLLRRQFHANSERAVQDWLSSTGRELVQAEIGRCEAEGLSERADLFRRVAHALEDLPEPPRQRKRRSPGETPEISGAHN